MRATFAEVSPQVTRITGLAPTDWIEVGQNNPSYISLSDALKELGISDRQLMKYRLIARKIKPYWDSALNRNPDYPTGLTQLAHRHRKSPSLIEHLYQITKNRRKINRIFLKAGKGINEKISLSAS